MPSNVSFVWTKFNTGIGNTSFQIVTFLQVFESPQKYKKLRKKEKIYHKEGGSHTAVFRNIIITIIMIINYCMCLKLR